MHNLNEHIQTQLVETNREHIIEYEAEGRYERLPEGSQQELGWRLYEDESTHLQTPDQATHEKWHKYDYEKVTKESQVTESSPAKIISGNHLTINADELWNKDSQILAGGKLTVSTTQENTHNQETFGEKQIFSENGKLYRYWRHRLDGTDTTGKSVENYTLPTQISHDVSLGLLAYQEFTQVDSAHQGTTGQRANVQVTGHLDQNTATQHSAKEQNIQDIDSKTQQQVVIRTGLPNAKLPSNSLFAINAQTSGYLIETDPRFTNYRQWLGSDYMLSALSLDPSNTHKRLGDGYYEQRLVNEQIAQLTGYRRLDGYRNDEEQFKALMDNGVTAAQSLQLVPGIALSAEQVARLTSDIVWLVTQNITLEDGTVQQVLVPQVYVRVKKGDIDGKGALLSGHHTQLDIAGTLNNSGKIAGRETLLMNANTVNNINGRITANQALINAKKDINNIGGTFDAEQALFMNAGGNIRSQSTVASAQDGNNHIQHIDRVAGIYITGNQNGTLALQAGHNIQLTGSEIQNQSVGGQTVLKAENDIKLDTVHVSAHQENHLDADNHIIRGYNSEVGSTVRTNDNLALIAGNDIDARAADVGSEQGNLQVSAKNVRIEAGKETVLVDDASKHTGRSGGGNKQVETSHVRSKTERSLSSSFDGKTVQVQAEQDINIKGSHVIGENTTVLQAGNNIHILASDEYSDSQLNTSFEKSGLMSSGGIGFIIGSKKDTSENKESSITHTGSTVGSLNGDTYIQCRQTIYPTW